MNLRLLGIANIPEYRITRFYPPKSRPLDQAFCQKADASKEYTRSPSLQAYLASRRRIRQLLPITDINGVAILGDGHLFNA